jgi:hypothetical protein
VRQGITLLLALVAGATAAGEVAPPAFPHEFYGSMTIDGATAPPLLKSHDEDRDRR